VSVTSMPTVPLPGALPISIALKGRAALIRGESGSGKSDLALRCLAQPASDLISGQALLVADDQVRAEGRGGKVHLSCPETIKGLARKSTRLNSSHVKISFA